MSLIDKVIAATHAAAAENTPPDGLPRSEAQNAAILIAQVQAILAGDQVSIEPPAESS